jgi:hypothetical protein
MADGAKQPVRIADRGFGKKREAGEQDEHRRGLFCESVVGGKSTRFPASAGAWFARRFPQERARGGKNPSAGRHGGIDILCGR